MSGTTAPNASWFSAASRCSGTGEKRSDEAIHPSSWRDNGLLRFARNDGLSYRTRATFGILTTRALGLVGVGGEDIEQVAAVQCCDLGLGQFAGQLTNHRTFKLDPDVKRIARFLPARRRHHSNAVAAQFDQSLTENAASVFNAL